MVAPALVAISSLLGSLLAAVLSTWQNVRVRPRPVLVSDHASVFPTYIFPKTHHPDNSATQQEGV